MSTPKETAKQMIDRLPEQATWDDTLYELHVKHNIERGLDHRRAVFRRTVF